LALYKDLLKALEPVLILLIALIISYYINLKLPQEKKSTSFAANLPTFFILVFALPYFVEGFGCFSPYVLMMLYINLLFGYVVLSLFNTNIMVYIG